MMRLTAGVLFCGLSEGGTGGIGLPGCRELNPPLPADKSVLALCRLAAPVRGFRSQMYCVTADVSSIWEKEGENDDLETGRASKQI